jgi:hypothetical protein
MGIEYKILIQGARPEDLDQILKDEPLSCLPESGMYEFRAKDRQKGEMPDACAEVEADGLYFCDYGGEGRFIMERLIKRLEARYAKVEKRDYE